MCKARLWLGWILLTSVAGSERPDGEGYVLLRDGTLSQTIYVNGIEKRVLREAVLELQDVLEEMVARSDGEEAAPTERPVRIVVGTPPEGATGIVVDPGAFPVVWADPEPDTVVWEAGRDRLVITGRGIEGTALAVYRFLDREGGVRWFWPGDLGREVPRRRDWTVPAGRMVDAPVFESRTLTGLRGREATLWGLRNGLRSHYPGLHGLQRIFTETVFRDHPDWSAVPFDPDDPPGPGSRFWKQQPNLAHPGVVAHTAEVVRARFEENPSLLSVSIGVADNLRYGKRPEVMEQVEPRRWFRGQPDYSNLIFGFANRVAEIVARDHPGRFLMVLAYQWGEAVPDGPVHPMVIPLLTADRAGGYQVDFTVGDQKLISDWRAKETRKLSVYEYWHGLPHLFPRQAMVLWAARLRDARERGVELFRGELNPFWGLDGAKPWVLVRLLWDPEVDVKVLEREFYGEFFGPAGPAVDAFFDVAEGVWMRQRGHPFWVRYFDDENGPLIFDETSIATMAQWLARAREAVADSRESRYAQRLAVVEEAFSLFRELRELQAGRADLMRSGTPVGIGPFALRVARWWERYGDEPMTLGPRLQGRYRHITLPVEHHLGLVLEREGPGTEALRSELAMTPEFSHLAEELDALVNGNWETLAGAEDWAASLGRKTRTGLDEASFVLEGPWKAAVDPYQPFRALIEPESGTLRLENALASGIRQRVAVAAGDWLWVSAKISARVSGGNRSSIFIRWFDEEGRNRIKSLPTVLPMGDYGGNGFRPLHLVVEVPEGIVEGEVYFSAVYQQPEDYLEIRSPSIRRWHRGQWR